MSGGRSDSADCRAGTRAGPGAEKIVRRLGVVQTDRHQLSVKITRLKEQRYATAVGSQAASDSSRWRDRRPAIKTYDTHRETKIYSRVIRVKRRIMDEERGKHTAAQVSGVWGKQMEIETVTLKRDQRTPALHYTGYLVQTTVC